jgi:hypothetical protein
MLDPDEKITGRGVLRLQEAGIRVDFFVDRLYRQVAEQNRLFSRSKRKPPEALRQTASARESIRVAPVLGLVAVAPRDDHTEILPPADFYESAKREILITAISAARTFDIHMHILRTALVRGKRVLVLILNPASPDVRALNKREGRPINTDIRTTLRVARDEGFLGSSAEFVGRNGVG